MEDKAKTREQPINEPMKSRQRIAEEEPGTQPIMYQLPARLLIIMVLSVFAAHAFLMLLHISLHPSSTWSGALFDSILMVVLLLPALYFFVFRPLVLHVTERVRAEEALWESEERYRSTLDSMLEGCQIIGFDWCYLYANDAVAKQGRQAKEELLGHTMMERYPGIEDTKMFAVLRRCMEKRTPQRMENEFTFPDGAKGWFDLSIQPVPEGIFILSIDITERKRAEEALREAEQRYRDLFEEAPVMYVITRNQEGVPVVADCNHLFLNTLGYSRAKVLGRPLADFYAPESRAELLEGGGYQRALEGQFSAEERKLLTRDGRVVETLLRALPETGLTGQVSGTRAMYVNIAERKRAEEALAEERNLLRTLIDTLPDFIYAKDTESRFVLGNIAVARHMDATTPDELLGKTDFDFYPQELAARYHADEQEIIRSGQPLINREEPLLNLATGERGWISTTKVPLRDSHGQVVGIVSIGRDITERKLAEERIQQQLQRLGALRQIDMAITASLDLRVTFNILLDQLAAQLGVDAADILLLNPHTLTLEYAAGRGFRTAALQHTHLRLGEGHAGRAALERRIVSIPNIAEAENGFGRTPLLAGEEFITYYGVPLIAKGQAKGVLEIFHRAPRAPDPEWLDFLEILAGQAAIAVDNTTLFDDLQRSNVELTLAYDTTLEGWARALELRDRETEGHSRRVTELTLRLARALGMSDEELNHVRRGALLHDIGKMGVPDSMLLKPGPLTEEERDIMRQHPVYAYELLSPIAHLRPALDIPYCHHEKWDGTGYPRGLKGEEIPLAARVFAVVDVWDALNSERPYRPAWPEEKVYQYIHEQAGKHFDPQVVEVFLEIE